MREPPTTPTAPVYAGFWRRFNAYGIDATIIVIIGWLLDTFLLGQAFAQSSPQAQQLADTLMTLSIKSEDAKLLADAVVALQTGQIAPGLMELVRKSLVDSALGGSILGPDKFLMMAISAIYNIFFVVGPWHATPGKHWLDMKVLHRDGSPLTLAQSAARHVLSGLSMLPLGLGCLTIPFSREKCAPHDMICGTRVVRSHPHR